MIRNLYAMIQIPNAPVVSLYACLSLMQSEDSASPNDESVSIIGQFRIVMREASKHEQITTVQALSSRRDGLVWRRKYSRSREMMMVGGRK